MNFERALITGASSGIGEALAHLLAKKGVKLILSGRNIERLKEVAQSVGAEEIVVADLKSNQERQKLVEVIEKKVPDLVINNAGYGLYGDVLSLSIAEQLAIAEVNALATLELTLVAVRTQILREKKGVIINISSVAGEYPCPGMSIYGAAKAFVTSFSRAFNTEVSSYGVHVLVSCPGMVATDFGNRAAKKPIKLDGGPILSAEYAAEQIWKQIVKKKEKHIFNWQYRLGSLLANTLIPLSVVKKIIWTQIKKRRSHSNLLI